MSIIERSKICKQELILKYLEFTVEEKDHLKRLDTVITENMEELSRSQLKSREVEILVNGEPSKLSYKAKIGDVVNLAIPDVKAVSMIPQDVPFDLLYSDEDIAVVNKPAGIAVHPSRGHEDGTLVNGLLYRLGDKLSGIGGEERPGIVHRLDKDTAGILVVAMNDAAHRNLTEQFKAHSVEKIYHAVVMGHPPESGEMKGSIGRSPKDRKKMAVVEEGKEAFTEYRVMEYLEDHAYVEVKIHTGRTHQIRVHFSNLNFPIAGDPIYSRGKTKYPLRGIALCAKKLSFDHPKSGERLNFEIELPGDLSALIRRLKST